jgi:hypothetical protein
MTVLATNDNRTICRIQLTGEGRCVSLALSLGEIASTPRFLVISDRFLYDMAAFDEMAREYDLSNWQGGVVSGARYAFRALKAPIQQVCLHELRGQLSSGDVWTVSAAAALAVARLLARTPEFPLDLGGWAMEEEVQKPQPVVGPSQSTNADSSQPGTPKERAENHSSASGKTD